MLFQVRKLTHSTLFNFTTFYIRQSQQCIQIRNIRFKQSSYFNKERLFKIQLPSLHIQIELDTDTIQDYSSFIQSRKSYLKSSIYSNLSDSDSDHDHEYNNLSKQFV